VEDLEVFDLPLAADERDAAVPQKEEIFALSRLHLLGEEDDAAEAHGRIRDEDLLCRSDHGLLAFFREDSLVAKEAHDDERVLRAGLVLRVALAKLAPRFRQWRMAGTADGVVGPRHRLAQTADPVEDRNFLGDRFLESEGTGTLLLSVGPPQNPRELRERLSN